MKHTLQGFPHDGAFESHLLSGWTQTAGAGVPYTATVEHGLLQPPSMVRWVLVCVVALSNVAEVGDEIDVSGVFGLRLYDTDHLDNRPAFSTFSNEVYCGICWQQQSGYPCHIVGRNANWVSLDTHEDHFRLKCYAWR